MSQAIADRTVRLRIDDDRAGVESITLVLISVGTDLDEVRRDGLTIGYIRHVGRLFVALSGIRQDRAEECGQFPLWDYAAQRLVSAGAPWNGRRSA
jgi:hypothetical protein